MGWISPTGCGWQRPPTQLKKVLSSSKSRRQREGTPHSEMAAELQRPPTSESVSRFLSSSWGLFSSLLPLHTDGQLVNRKCIFPDLWMTKILCKPKEVDKLFFESSWSSKGSRHRVLRIKKWEPLYFTPGRSSHQKGWWKLRIRLSVI